jgi:hypothetical protein
MKVSAKQAVLLSVREREMVESKGPWQVKQLVTVIKRSRELRDKHRQLAQRQSIAATRRNLQKPEATNIRTDQKAELFDRALKHFEAELDKLNSESTAAARELGIRSPASNKPAVKKRTAVRKTVAPKKTVSKKARVAVPKQLGAQARSQAGSQASRRTRGKKTR